MTLIYFILILGITVFIHELGHFIFAKKAGVHVYEFSIGMGPAIFKKKRKNDDTLYCIRLFPIGGFVSIAGEDDYIDKEIPKDKQLLFKPWKNRFMTMIAGVMFNFILAIVLLFFVGIAIGAPKYESKVSRVDPAYPLSDTNLKAGDTIIKYNNSNIHTTDKLALLLTMNKGEEVTLTVKHEDKTTEEIKVKPIKVEEDSVVAYRFGLELDNTKTKDILSLIIYPFKKTYSLVEQMVLILKNLITGNLSLDNLSGPIGIYTVVDETAKAGFINVIYLIAYLCINVGFINLIPFPAFDGGRALFLIIEKIRGKAINPKTENMIHTIGFYLLMALMVLITYNDIIKLIG